MPPSPYIALLYHTSGGFYDWFIALIPYGDELRKSRQLLHKYFQSSVVSEYLPIQEASTHNLLRGLLKNPEDYAHLIRQ